MDKKTFENTINLEDKVDYYNEANKQVAILCNHQKAAPKNNNSATSSQNSVNYIFIYLKVNELKVYLNELEDHAESFTSKKSKKIKKMEEKQIKKEENTKEKEENKKESKSKLKKIFPDSKEKTEKLIDTLKKKLEKLENTITKKAGLNQVALGTSKLNYMDPRITVSWCKNNEVPIEKVFSKNIRDKFPWAMYSELEYKF